MEPCSPEAGPPRTRSSHQGAGCEDYRATTSTVLSTASSTSSPCTVSGYETHPHRAVHRVFTDIFPFCRCGLMIVANDHRVAGVSKHAGRRHARPPRLTFPFSSPKSPLSSPPGPSCPPPAALPAPCRKKSESYSTYDVRLSTFSEGSK